MQAMFNAIGESKAYTETVIPKMKMLQRLSLISGWASYSFYPASRRRGHWMAEADVHHADSSAGADPQHHWLGYRCTE